MEKPYNQSFENHVRIVPPYHQVALPIFALNVFWSLYRVVRAFLSDSIFVRVDSIAWFLVAVALAILCLYARLFATTVQDRVIRLEMHMRLNQFLPPEPAATHRRVHPAAARLAAVRQRRRAAGVGAPRARRELDRPQGHQAHDQELEAGLPAGLREHGQGPRVVFGF